MDLRKLLQDVKDGSTNIDDALSSLKNLPYEDIGYANIDHHREIRIGYPEVIYCEGKSDEHILGIIERMMEKGSNILGTRCRRETFEKIKRVYSNSEYEKISKINPYSIKDLKCFHGIMTKYLVEESGDFRVGQEGVFNGEQCIFMAPPAQFVPQLMEELFNWMKRSQREVHPLILSSVFHYEFVFIHPFADGNGRMARLWHTAILSKWKPIFEYIPLESQIEKFQEDYYDAIEKCHMAGESTLFIEFMLEQIDKILDEFSIQFSRNNEQLSEYVKKLLEIMEYDVPYTSNLLMEKLNLKSKEGFRRNYLHPAMEMNLIRMTIPDKPNSRNQRYVKI